MAAKHELEIEIDAQGKIQVHVKGAKGKQCLEYIKIFNTIGKTSDQQTTSEYYEPEPRVGIIEDIRTRFER
jgi:hypothetical protein